MSDQAQLTRRHEADCLVLGLSGSWTTMAVAAQDAALESVAPDGAKRARSHQWNIESTPCLFHNHDIEIRVSLGMKAYGPDGTAEELVRQADMSMY